MSLEKSFLHQGSVGSCNCGYIMFSKRSGNTPHLVKDKDIDKTNQGLPNNMMDMSKTDSIPDHALVEMSTMEILEALDILDRVNNSQNDDAVNDLSEREV